MVAADDKIPRVEPASYNHDSYAHCKAPSVAFHLDQGRHDLLLHETLNVYERI
jgi:hypothetical protein